MKNWDAFPPAPLPPDLYALPTLTAEPWVQLSEDTQLCAEGPLFDNDGNLYACIAVPPPGPAPRIVKISPDGKVHNFFVSDGSCMPLGLAMHKDGRIFAAAMLGGIAVIRPDGSLESLIPTVYEDGDIAMPNDCVFDDKGNLYFTDYRGDVADSSGAIAKLSAESGYAKLSRLVGGLWHPNGISFSPDFRTLWVGESNRNAIVQIRLDENGEVAPMGETINYVYYNQGLPMPDGNKVDSAGYCYQAIMKGGRVLILDPSGIPAANVLVPERETGCMLSTSNLVIRPNSSEAYLLAAGTTGVWVLRFPTIAPAQTLFAQM